MIQYQRVTDRRTDIQPIAKTCFSIAADARKNFIICKRKNLILDSFIGFEPVKRSENRSGVSELGGFNNSTSKTVLDC